MSELPENWIITSLSEVATWGSGGTPSRTNLAYFGGGIPWIKTGELGKPLIERTEETISELGLANSSAKVFPRGSIAIAMYGATIGKVSVLGIDAATNQACAVGIPDQNLTNDEFLYYYLCSQKDPFIEAGKGAAQPNISQAVLKNWLVPLPPLNEQKRIADKLDALRARVDTCRERHDRIPLILKRFRQSVFAAATSGELTEDWRASKDISSIQPVLLSEVLSEIKTGPFGSALHKSDYVAGKIPVVNPMHINDRKITHSDDMTVSPKKAEELSNFRLRYEDVVIARRGVMGRCAVVKPEQEGWLCGTGCIILRVQSQLLPNYLQLFLSSPGNVEVLEANAVGSTMVNLNQRVLLSLQLSLPTLQEQQEIVRRAESLFAYADRLEAHYQVARTQVDRLTPTLLAKAFCGELVPQDPNDEPASVLLERIRAERAAQPAKPKRTQASRKLTITKMTEESVKEAIRQLPKDKFSFDELRENIPGNYDSLKDILFALLSEAEPSLEQVFDREEQAMCFVRAGK